MGKTLVNTINFQLVLAMAILKGYIVFVISKIDVTLFDINVIYLIHMQREETVVNERSIAWHGVILFSCSISMNFLCLWKTWFKLLKCWHTSIALWFFISFLWLFSFILKEVSEFPTCCILQRRHSIVTCLWKTWFRLLKSWHASVALWFFISFLWLFSFMWNGVSEFLT